MICGSIYSNPNGSSCNRSWVAEGYEVTLYRLEYHIRNLLTILHLWWRTHRVVGAVSFMHALRPGRCVPQDGAKVVAEYLTLLGRSLHLPDRHPIDLAPTFAG